MGVVGSVVGGTAAAVFDAAGTWVARGAVWLLGQVGHALSATSSVDLGAGWFTDHERVMAAVAAAVVLPMACCATILAVYRQDASMLLRTFLVHLPLALLLTGVAVELVRLSLAITDTLSAHVLAAGGVDTEHLLAPVSAFLLTTGPVLPAFVLFLGGLLVALASLLLWLELVVRSTAITAATLFLPLALAGLVWPAVSHWCRRLADTIAALVLSKLVIAAVLSLAAGALASGSGFGTVVVGIALLVIATTAPFTLFRLVPAVDAGAVLHLESARHRLGAAATAPLRAGAFAKEVVADARRRAAERDGEDVATPEHGNSGAGTATATSRTAGVSVAMTGVPGAAVADASGIPQSGLEQLPGDAGWPERSKRASSEGSGEDGERLSYGGEGLSQGGDRLPCGGEDGRAAR